MRRIDHVLSIKKDGGLSDLNCFSLLLEMCNVFLFLPLMSSSVYFSCDSPNELVLLLFPCKFLMMVPNFWNVTFCCFPARIQNANVVRQSEHP